METWQSKLLQNVSMGCSFVWDIFFLATIEEMIGHIANWTLGVNLKMELMEVSEKGRGGSSKNVHLKMVNRSVYQPIKLQVDFQV